MIFLIWLLNFGISWLNAFICGNIWDSTKARGGSAHFMTWMGAIMSASGFTWCYLLVAGLVCSELPLSLFVEAEEGAAPVAGMLLDADSLQAFCDLGYLVIIFPILGSGLAITVQTWREFARRGQQRGVSDYAITGWNTFAQIDNTFSAMRALPGVFDRLSSFGSSDKDSWKEVLIAALVAVCVLGGVCTTYSIVQSRRNEVIRLDYNRARFGA